MEWELELTQQEFTDLQQLLASGKMEEETAMHNKDRIVVWVRYDDGGRVYEKKPDGIGFATRGIAHTPAGLHALLTGE